MPKVALGGTRWMPWSGLDGLVDAVGACGDEVVDVLCDACFAFGAVMRGNSEPVDVACGEGVA